MACASGQKAVVCELIEKYKVNPDSEDKVCTQLAIMEYGWKDVGMVIHKSIAV